MSVKVQDILFGIFPQLTENTKIKCNKKQNKPTRKRYNKFTFFEKNNIFYCYVCVDKDRQIFTISNFVAIYGFFLIAYSLAPTHK